MRLQRHGVDGEGGRNIEDEKMARKVAEGDGSEQCARADGGEDDR